MKIRHLVLMAGSAGLLAGCASVGRPCDAGLQAMTTEHLYFGTDKPGGRVSDEEWRAFVDEVVTPRFPDGLSVWSAAGQWKSQAGPIVREASHVLNLVHDGSPARQGQVEAIAAAYKTRFAQEAVMRVRGSACVSF